MNPKLLLASLMGLASTISFNPMNRSKKSSGGRMIHIRSGSRADYPEVRSSKVGSRRIYRNQQKADVCRNFKFSF